MGLAILTALMSCQTYPNVCIVQGQTYRQIFTAEGDWSGAVCRGQIRDNWLGSDGTIKAVFEFGSLTYDAEIDLTTVEGVVSHQQTTLLPATKYQGVGTQSVKNSLVYDIEIELGNNVYKLAPGYVRVIAEVTDDSIIYDPPVIWDGGINGIELTETNGLVDTYTVWGDVDKTINLGTFNVTNSEGVGIESANYDNSTGILTFVYTDGAEFSTEDIRGEQGNAGVGIQSTEYNPLTGILTFTFTDSSEFATDDLRADLDAATIKTRYESNDDTNAFTDAEKTKLSGLNATDYATAAQGLLAEAALQPGDIDLSPYALSSDVSLALDNKVDKVAGKGLSTEDYTSEEKTKLGNLVLPETLTGKALYYYDTNSGLFKPLGIGTAGQTLIAQPSSNPPYQWAAPTGGGRELLTADRTYYVRTDGSDSNDGLSDTAGGAFLTIQKFIDTAAALDLSIYNAIGQLQSGTWTLTTPIVLKGAVGTGEVRLRGNPLDPTTTKIVGSGNWNYTGLIQSQGLGNFAIDGFNFAGGGTNQYDIETRSPVLLRVNNCLFSGSTKYLCIYLSNGTICRLQSNRYSGNCPVFLWTSGTGVYCQFESGYTTTVTGGVVSAAIVYTTWGSQVDVWAGHTFTGSATGKKYVAENYGMIYRGTALPGTIAGTLSGGIAT